MSGRKLRHLSAGSKRKVVGCNKKLVARNLGGKTPAVVLVPTTAGAGVVNLTPPQTASTMISVLVC